jgi:hypothetical protein
MCLVTYRRTDRASETADKYGTFSSFFYGIRIDRAIVGIERMHLCLSRFDARVHALARQRRYRPIEGVQGFT